MFRALILGLVLFVAFGTIVPLATEYTEASARSLQRKQIKKKRAKKYRRLARKKARKRSRIRRSYRSANRKKVVRRKKVRRSPVRRSSKRRVRSSARKKTVKRRTVAKRRYKSKRRVVKRKKRSTKRYSARRTKRTYKKRSYKKRSTRRSTARTKRTYKKRKATRRVVRKKSQRKYTKKWWANYRAAKARKAAVAKRKRSMRLKSIRLAKKKDSAEMPSSVRYSRIKATASPAPRTRVDSNATTQPTVVATGDVSMDVVGSAVGETVLTGRRTAVGGVSTTTLRRTVIDQMIQENGWVENDFHKEIGGKKVYVVVAKTPGKNNRVESRTYYFTESEGRIYRVATRSANDGAESAQRSETLIRSLNKSTRPQQAQNQ